MFTNEEVKKYYRFTQKLHDRSALKKDVEDFNSIFNKFQCVSKSNNSIKDFIDYFSKSPKDQTKPFMSGGCGYFASFLDLIFGEESSGYLIVTIGRKDCDINPDNISYNYSSEYEKLDIIGEECGFSHILYMFNDKYYDACGEYNSLDAVLKHIKKYYKNYIEDNKEKLSGEIYLSSFKNKDLWLVEKKDLFKKKARVHYVLSIFTNNLFNDILEMLDMMRNNVIKNDNSEYCFKNKSFKYN